MGSPIPPVLNGPKFHDGWPAHTMGGPGSYYLFEVRLADGTATQAIVMGETVSAPGNDGPGTYIHFWVRADGSGRIPTDQVLGWRDTIICGDIMEVMWQYVSKPYGVVARGEWANALNRHIRATKDAQGGSVVTCEACARLFVQAWQERHNEVPAGWEAFA